MADLKFDITDILEQAGDEISFSGSVALERVTIGERSIDFKTPVFTEGVFRNVGHGVLAKGKYQTTIASECSRCLDKFDQEVTGGLEELFVLDSSKHDGESREVFPISNRTVDLAPAVYQLVVTEIPFKPLCKNDCAGICPTCGKNLNKETHDCKEEAIDIRMSKLKDIFKNSKEGNHSGSS